MSARLVRPIEPDDHVIGPPNAPVTLVEYGDFECPHCGTAYPIIERIRQHFGDRLRFVYRHFPLTQAHPHAQHAAEMAEAAAERGAFWEMHRLLFEHQDALDDASLVRYAASVGVDADWAAEALATGMFESRVRHQFMGGVRSGVNGTPTFFINGMRYDLTVNERVLTATLESAALANSHV
jgi:protein-disulfide isomerase